MRPDTVRPGAAARSDGGPLKDLPLDPAIWQKAWQAHLDEDYEVSLADGAALPGRGRRGVAHRS